MDIKYILNKFGGAVKHNAPHILSGVSVVTAAAAIYSTHHATTKAHLFLEYHGRQLGYQSLGETLDKTSKKEQLSLTYKEYIPVAVLSTMAVTSLFGALYLHQRKNAALTGLYTMTSSLFDDYRKKVIDTIGEKKESKIVDEIRQDTLDKAVVPTNMLILGTGECLCYDDWSGRYFRSDSETIRTAANNAKSELYKSSYNFISLNDVYQHLGLNPISSGYDVGWNVDEQFEIGFSTHLASDNTPCLMVLFEKPPHSDYYN